MPHVTQFALDSSKSVEQNFQEKFLPWARENNVDFSDQQAVSKAVHVFYGGGSEADLAKHTVTDRPAAGWLYDEGPYTMREETLFNKVIRGGSALMSWIPTNRMEAKEEGIAYLDYVIPDGWDGSDYFAYLATLEIGSCEYGPGTAWSGSEMQVSFGEWSTSSETLERWDFGLPRHKSTPILSVRGASGMPMANDAEWATARVAINLERHHESILRFGTLGQPLQFDGLSNVISPGYVAAHSIGGGTPTWSDPLLYDGTSLTTVEEILTVLRAVVRKIIRRASQRNWSIGGTDMAIVVPAAIWPYLLDAIACGGNTGCGSAPTGYVINDVRAERARSAVGGLGFGTFEVDGMAVPVIPDDGMGLNVVDSNVNYTVGDIYVLVRRVNGINILEQQYLDFNMLDIPSGNWWTENGGITRVGWIDLNEKCWYSFAEQAGRFLCRMEPLQARITSVSVANVLENEAEQGLVYTDSYYALLEQDPLAPWGA